MNAERPEGQYGSEESAPHERPTERIPKEGPEPTQSFRPDLEREESAESPPDEAPSSPVSPSDFGVANSGTAEAGRPATSDSEHQGSEVPFAVSRPWEQPAPQGEPPAQYGPGREDLAPERYGQPGPAQQSWSVFSSAPGGQAGGFDQPGDPAHSVPGDQKNRRRGVGAGGFVAGVLLAGLLGGGIGAGAVALSSDGGTAEGGSGIDINSPDSATQVTAAASNASPSVVTLAVSDGAGAAGSGSGVVLDDEGHVLTNTHVVTLGGQSAEPDISVRLYDGSVSDAEIVGTDPLSDLAVVQLEDPGDLQPAEFGSSEDLNVGDQTIAIGAPLGLDGTVTDGIVSTLDRTIQVASSAVEEQDVEMFEPEEAPEEVPEEEEEGDEDGFEFYFPDLEGSPAQGAIYLNVIQTDAAINQGNSGGALVDSQGRVIGVNVAIASTGGGFGQEDAGSIGVGFAIPIDYAQRVAEELIEHGEVSHGLLGVTVNPAGPEGAEGDLLQGFSTGALVEEVADDSPATEAGIQDGDVITEVEGRSIEDSLSLTAIVREYAAGEIVEVTFLRDGEEQTVEVTLDGM